MKYRTPTSSELFGAASHLWTLPQYLPLIALFDLTGYALVRDLDFFHNKLSDLQKLDDSSAPVEEHTSVSLVKPEASDSRRQPRRENLRKNKTGPISYKETDEEVETIEIREGGTVQKLVADRKKLVEKVFAVSGQSLCFLLLCTGKQAEAPDLPCDLANVRTHQPLKTE